MRLLVVGATGLLGAELMALAPEGTVGLSRSAAQAKVDLLDERALAQAFQTHAPTCVVIAAGWNHVDGCERAPEQSAQENVAAIENLIACATSARLIYVSTDHVFDGSSTADDESATPNPLNVYARHKRKAEERILACDNSLVVRTSYLFGKEARRRNFVYRVLDAASERTPLRVPQGQAGTPTWARALARELLALAQAPERRGVLHRVGPEVLTKAAWARRIADVLGLPPLVVTEVSPQEAGQVAPRPARVHLTTRVPWLHPPLEVALRELST